MSQRGREAEGRVGGRRQGALELVGSDHKVRNCRETNVFDSTRNLHQETEGSSQNMLDDKLEKKLDSSLDGRFLTLWSG